MFSVAAPLGAPRAGAGEEIGAISAAMRGEPLSGLKVLAIDNEPRVLEGMRALLSRWGCVVATARGLVKRGRRLRASASPDVIIADYHLDEGDGVEAVRALRAELGMGGAGDPGDGRPQPRGAREAALRATSPSSTSR